MKRLPSFVLCGLFTRLFALPAVAAPATPETATLATAIPETSIAEIATPETAISVTPKRSIRLQKLFPLAGCTCATPFTRQFLVVR